VLELESGERGGVNLEQLLRVLGQRNVVSLIAEGGPTLLQSLFETERVDEVHAYVAPLLLGEAGLPLFPDGGRFDPTTLRNVVVEPLHPDVLFRGYTGTWSPERAEEAPHGT
jgi:diaminohydroxyphosphoribosylaminopyrimidine deaminase/5-amino-6-(5-phosphoribosylamino)uracil reductase